MGNRSFTTDLAELPDNGQALRIVVGWDAMSTEAVEFAAWLGRSLPVKVQVVSAVESSWPKPISEKKYRKWFKERSSEFEAQAKKVLKAYVPRQQWAKEACHLTERTDVVNSLYTSAEELSADMIVLGSKAKTAKSRFRPSSIADALMHSSPVPLGLAPKGVHLSRKGITRVTYALVESSKSATPKGEGRFSGLPYAATLACVLGVPLRIIAFSPSSSPPTLPTRPPSGTKPPSAFWTAPATRPTASPPQSTRTPPTPSTSTASSPPARAGNAPSTR
ncbi:universal stress protein [Corynebacterium aquatimens]|nr:universal stress protein [Corynebacterium aquatimens]QYH19057.1 universal stress protein [Corynebacterium aquatimens]